MALLTPSFRICSVEEAEILEAGCKRNSWTLVTDGRINNAEMNIGPVAYLGPIRKKEGEDGSDLPANDGLLMFMDQTDAVVAVFANVAIPTDLTETIADFLETSGASISVMQTKRPVVA